MHLNWLTQCSVQGDTVTDESPLAQALAYWIEQYQEEMTQRQQHENALLPWKQTKAEQRLRMEIALLQLWRQPKEAIAELYRLHSNLQRRDPRALEDVHGSGAGHHKSLRGAARAISVRHSRAGGNPRVATQKPPQITLPWKESELPAQTRWMLAEMGFGGRGEQEPAKLRMPMKLSLALGMCAGLAVVAIGTALWRLMAPATPVFRPACPRTIPDRQNPGCPAVRLERLPHRHWYP